MKPKSKKVDERVAHISVYCTEKSVTINVLGEGRMIVKMLLAICYDVPNFEELMKNTLTILDKQRTVAKEKKEDKKLIKDKIII